MCGEREEEEEEEEGRVRSEETEQLGVEGRRRE